MPSKRHKLETSFWIPADIDTVWSFASRPQNLAKISPPDLHIQVGLEGEAYEGAEFEIKIKPSFSPITINWGSRIENIKATGDERSFEDVQTHGPFAYWHHTHKFTKGTRDVESAAGNTVRSLSPGTWVSDSVVYELPLGILGSIAHQLVIKRILANMFRDRRHAVQEWVAKGL